MNHHKSFEIRQFTPPISTEMAATLASFLEHKGSPWTDDIQQRMFGRIPGALDRYFVIFDGNRMIGHAWHTVAQEDPRLGLIGHIFTHPDYRRCGIAERLMDASMTDFVERGGVMMQLFTSTPFSIAFYERLGFENLFAGEVYHDTDWYMRYPTPSAQLVSEWFRPSKITTRGLTSADLPQYCLLYNCEHQRVLKDRSHGIGSGLEAELAFIDVIRTLELKRGVCRVARNDRTIVGAASMIRNSFPHQSHIAIFDYYVPSAFESQLPSLAQECLDARHDLGVEVVYAIGVDDDKRKAFSELGFASKGVFADHYKVGNRRFACELFQLE